MFGLRKRRAITQEKASNANSERLMTAVAAMESAFFQWKVGLNEEEREKPEAAAALMGMFDSVARAIGLNIADSVPTFCVALGKASDPVTQNLDAGALLSPFVAGSTLSEPNFTFPLGNDLQAHFNVFTTRSAKFFASFGQILLC
jgi:hypothetical protein